MLACNSTCRWINCPVATLTGTALVNFESELRTFTGRLDDLKSSIESGLRTLEQRRQNYEIQKNALILADRRVASTTLLLEAGRAEVRDLVDAQDAQIASQNAVTAAMVDYQQTRGCNSCWTSARWTRSCRSSG